MRPSQEAIMDWQCRCTTADHEHLDNRCPKPAVTADGYCQECHDKAAKEAMDAQPITQGDELQLGKTREILPSASAILSCAESTAFKILPSG
jgi:hypothetical protein